MSLAIFFSFYGINFRGSCDLHESQLPLFWIIYFPIAPFLFNIAQKPLFPIIEWIAGSVLKSPFFKDTAVSGRYRRVHFYLL